MTNDRGERSFKVTLDPSALSTDLHQALSPSLASIPSHLKRGHLISNHLISIGLIFSCFAFISGCPDTKIPSLYSERSARLCSFDELQSFRDASTESEREDLWIAFVDVGQGDSTWIRTPGTRDLDAKDILVDTGNCLIDFDDCGFSSQVVQSGYESDGVNALMDFMVENGWLRGSPIDYLIATHSDKDHFGGTWKILNNYRVKSFISPGGEQREVNKTYSAALEAVDAEPDLINLSPVEVTGINASAPNEGELLTQSWGRNVTVRLISADRNASEDNNASVVLMVDFRGVKILLTGDSQESLDARLLTLDDTQRVNANPSDPSAAASILKADVLKAGHHGGAGTNTQALLDRVFSGQNRRRFAVISSGRRDNLPAPDTIERLQTKVGDFGLYRTDRGDEGKDQTQSPGDDHILLRVSKEGDLTLCYAYPDP